MLDACGLRWSGWDSNPRRSDGKPSRRSPDPANSAEPPMGTGVSASMGASQRNGVSGLGTSVACGPLAVTFNGYVVAEKTGQDALAPVRLDPRKRSRDRDNAPAVHERAEMWTAASSAETPNVGRALR